MKAPVGDSVGTLAQVVSAWWHDRIFVTIIAVAAMAWLSALCLGVVKQPFLLHKLAIPLAVSLYPPDEVPTPEGVQRCLSLLAEAAGLMGGLTLGYACLWHYLLRCLPTGAPSLRVSTTAALSTLECCCLAAVCVLAVILRLHHITRGLTLDELTTAIKFVDVSSPWTTLSTDSYFNNHLANSLLAYLSQRLLGRSEWALRLPALLLGLISLYSLWAFTRRFAGSALAVLATAALAFSPAHIFWSVTARGYMGMLLFTLVSTSLYWQILDYSSWRKGLLFTVSNVLAILFHPFAALVVLTQFVFLLYLAVREMATGRSGRVLTVGSCRIFYLALPVIVGMSLACYALMIPHYLHHFRELEHGAFYPLFPLKVLELLSYGPAHSVGLGWLLVGAMGGLCTVGWIAFRHKCARVADYWVCLGIVPFLIVIPARPHYLDTRFFFFLLPFYLILVGGGLLMAWQAATTHTERMSRTMLQGCCLLVGGAILGTWLVRVWVGFPHLEHGFREAAWAMERETTPTMGLCVIGWSGWRLQYYLNRDLFIPQNRDDFDQFLRRYPAIACADTSPGESDEPDYILGIRAFLAQHAASHRFRGIIVYTYGKAP
jgi:hypothetical protein